MKNTTFDNHFGNFNLNVTTLGMLMDTIEIDMSHDFGCYGNHLGGKLKFPSYQNVCIYKVGWCSITRVLSVISLERAGHRHSNKACGICIAAILRKISTSM